MARVVSAAVARRYLVLRHLLAPPRSLPAEPSSVMRVFDRLGSLQFDPIDIAGRNHDLALLARIRGYRREWTDDLLERIRRDGPLSSREIPARASIDWFWRPTNPVRAMLEALALAGVLGLVRRDGNQRVYDLVERLFPADLLQPRPDPDEQRRHRLLSR